MGAGLIGNLCRETLADLRIAEHQHVVRPLELFFPPACEDRFEIAGVRSRLQISHIEAGPEHGCVQEKENENRQHGQP